MNIKISRIFYLVLIVFVASLFIPKFYWMKFEKSIYDPMVYFSPVSKQILVTRSTGTTVLRTDKNGKSYSREQFEQLMPLMNYRQLIVDGKLPDTIQGVAMEADKIRLNNFWMRIRPYELDYAPINLYPMFESKSGRVRLEMPNDYFRITKRFEFIDCATNSVIQNKTKLFTDKLIEEKFSFPSVMVSGNPNPKKPFDEGYFVLDSKNEVYHIKMVKGKPYCQNIHIPQPLDIAYMKIGEMPLREFYGYIFTKSGEVFLIKYHNYDIVKLPVPSYDIKNESISISGDIFYRTICLTGSNKVRTVVTDRNYNVIDSYEETWKDNKSLNAGIAASYLFPFTFSLNDISSSYSNFFIEFSDIRSIYLSVILAIATIFILRKRDISVKKGLFDILLVLITGIFGFIAVALVKNIDNQLN